MSRSALSFVCLGSTVIAAGLVAAAWTPHAEDAKTNRLLVVIRTSDIDKAGTDADIDFGLTWSADHEKRGEFWILPDVPGNSHEKGDIDVHAVGLASPVSIRQIHGAQIVNEMGGHNPGWHVHSLAMIAIDQDDNAWLLSDSAVNRWLERTSPSMTSLAVPMKGEPRLLGSRAHIAEVSRLFVAQDLKEKRVAQLSNDIAEAQFKAPGRRKATDIE